MKALSSVDFLVKLRDAAQMMADAANEYIERLAPKDEKHDWDALKIRWTQAEGSKGPYERSEDVNNLEFKAMLKDLASHSGKMQRNGYFYWTFQNGSTIGRKRK